LIFGNRIARIAVPANAESEIPVKFLASRSIHHGPRYENDLKFVSYLEVRRVSKIWLKTSKRGTTTSCGFAFHVLYFDLSVEARTVLWYMSFIGFIVNYMIRINLNITIVDMIAGKGEIPSNVTLNSSIANSTDLADLPELNDRFSLERWFLDWANVSIISLNHWLSA